MLLKKESDFRLLLEARIKQLIAAGRAVSTIVYPKLAGRLISINLHINIHFIATTNTFCNNNDLLLLNLCY